MEILNEEELDILKFETKETFESLFIKHYFKKEYNQLTKEDKHEMDCFGLYGMTEWVMDNVEY